MFLRFRALDPYVLQMLDLLERRCSVWFAMCCIAPWRYDWTHLHDRYDKSDFFSSNIISFLSCFRGISAKLSKQYYLKFPVKYFFCSLYSGWVFLGLLTDRGAKLGVPNEDSKYT